MNITKEELHEVIKEYIKENLKVVVETDFDIRRDRTVVEVKLCLCSEEPDWKTEFFTSSFTSL